MSATQDSNGVMNPFAIPFIPLASSQPSFPTRRTRKPRSTVWAEGHEGDDALLFRDQTPCPTTPTTGRSVGQNTSSQISTEVLENTSHGTESDRNQGEGSFAAGNKIIESSGLTVGSQRALESPEINIPQTHRMAREKAASDTNNDAFLGNLIESQGPQAISTEVVPTPELRPPGLYPYFIYPVVPPLPYGGGHSIYPRPPVLPVLPSPPPPPGPCFPLLHMVPCQIMDVSTGQPLPDLYTFAFKVTYWSLPIFAMPNPSFQIQDQNPYPLQEEMNARIHGHLAHRPHHPPSLTQALNAPGRIDEVQACSSGLDEPRAVEYYGQGLAEKCTGKRPNAEAELPTVYQGCTEETGSLSAVAGPQAGKKNDGVEQLLQQGCHVLFSSQHHHNAANESIQPDTSPFMMHPANRPSAKYSRKGQASDRSSQNQTPAEVASWSQSKRWLSSETKERRAFQKMMLNLQFMKADQSPFIPKTPAELTKFKISLAEARQQKLAHEVSILEEKTRQKELAKASGLALASKPQITLFNGRDMGDRLSPVFAAQNCFNKQDVAEVNSRVEWPSLAELKEEGDRRTRCGRYLPLPRINVVAIKIPEGEQEHTYKVDGTIL
ncbi:hypothetical protein TrVGV298_005632 [Trichoderma virens]|nr:hypothetical protein TrVGV298_005632 [Trichoderma virens]